MYHIYTKNILFVYLLSSILISCGAGHPPFDTDKPDTENNRFHYEHLINVKISPDVVNLYADGDEIGIDAAYYLAFECNKETALRIINSNKLLQDEKLGIPLINGYKTAWWDTNEIESLPRFVYKNEDETYFKYFWYNESNQHAYFMDFDL